MRPMRTTVGLVAVVVAAVAIPSGAWLAFNLAMAGNGSCPTALLEGTLVKDEGTLAVKTEWGPDPASVAWPFGYSVEERDGELVLTHLFGVVAHVGDAVAMGGGEGGAVADFRACGPVSVG
jgi:hypothetical protein